MPSGASLILVSLLYAFNLSAFLMELLWLGISIYGIVRGRRASVTPELTRAIRIRCEIAMTRERVFGLDFLRALAILLVLVAHASFMFLPLTHRLEAWWMLGHLGVELFFVLSGFLIGAILAELAAAEPFPLGRFWMRRWLRTLAELLPVPRHQHPDCTRN